MTGRKSPVFFGTRKRRLKKPLVSGRNTGSIAPLDKSLSTAVCKSLGYSWCWKRWVFWWVEVEIPTPTALRSQACETHGNRLTDSATAGQNLSGEPLPATSQWRAAEADPPGADSFLLERLLRPLLLNPPRPCCCWGCPRCWRDCPCCWPCLAVVEGLRKGCLPLAPVPRGLLLVWARFHTDLDWAVPSAAGFLKFAERPPWRTCCSRSFMISS